MKSLIALTAGLMGLIASSASAALIISTTRTPITSGPAAGYDRVVLFALNDVTPENGGELIGAEITVLSAVPNGIRFQVLNFNNTPVATVLQLPGDFTQAVSLNNSEGTSGNDKLFGNLSVSPRGFQGSNPPEVLAPPNTFITNPTFSQYTTGLTMFRLTGIDTSPVNVRGSAATPAQNGGRGLAVMTAVVPTGTRVDFFGSIGDETNANYNFNTIPEPTSVLALGAVSAVVLRRRSH
jgi:hypothetical protein